MDIKRAKKEIRDSIEAYLAKDEYGDYMIPSIRQRPILLIGASGNWKDTGYGTGRKRVQDCTGSLYDHPSYQTKCSWSAIHRKKELWRKRICSYRIYDE